METCEICGKETRELYFAKIEEATMWVCAACSKGKPILKSVDLDKVEKRNLSFKKNNEEEEVVENFGEQIRSARERLSLPVKVLAEKINEKESTLVRIEKEKAFPTETLRKKLERELGIKLIAKAEMRNSNSTIGKNTPITLGDAAFTKNDLKKKEEK
jgi:uncharacterized protein (TIGR00270 family)